MNKSPGRRFVILDRDGTLIVEREYLADPKDVALLPGAGAAVRSLQQMGLGVVLITNQSGVGRGFFTLDQLALVQRRVIQLLAEEGVRLDGVYICPHAPDAACACRKPEPGLLRQAAAELGFHPEDSIVIGDKPDDIEMGRRAGATTVLVRTGYGARFESSVAADFVVDDLVGAMRLIRSLLLQKTLSP